MCYIAKLCDENSLQPDWAEGSSIPTTPRVSKSRWVCNSFKHTSRGPPYLVKGRWYCRKVLGIRELGIGGGFRSGLGHSNGGAGLTIMFATDSHALQWAAMQIGFLKSLACLKRMAEGEEYCTQGVRQNMVSNPSGAGLGRVLGGTLMGEERSAHRSGLLRPPDLDILSCNGWISARSAPLYPAEASSILSPARPAEQRFSRVGS